MQRIVALTKHLPEFDWCPVVLSVRNMAYPAINAENAKLIPAGTRVIRSTAFDAARHLSILGKYPDFLALPDRWQSWIPFGVLAGLREIRRARPRMIMSSFPIASAHLIARTLHRLTGVPWIADLRDPMVLDNYPPPGAVREVLEKLEFSVFDEAARILVTTPGAASIYRERFPSQAAKKLRIVENGFDEDIFARVASRTILSAASKRRKILHSGLIYAEARDPRPLFRALSFLRKSGELSDEEFEVVFRASGKDSFISSEAKKHGLESLVSVKSSLPYEESIAEMLESDSLLLLQSEVCNSQIPAKAYEYLRCNKPILALTDALGDTGRLLRDYGQMDIAALENPNQIITVVRNHIARLKSKQPMPVTADFDIHALSRRARSEQVAKILNELAGEELPFP